MSEQSKKITGADALVMMLDKMGVKHIFGVCGDTSLPFYDSLTKLNHDITHILTRDERSAAYMADVYARLTNKVGVVEGPSGAGATYIFQHNSQQQIIKKWQKHMVLKHGALGILTTYQPP